MKDKIVMALPLFVIVFTVILGTFRSMEYRNHQTSHEASTEMSQKK